MKHNNYLLTITLILFLCTGCSFNYLSYLQQIKSPDGKSIYCLFLDGVGIGDPGYYILKLDNNIDPSKVYIKWNTKNGVSEKDSKWLKDKTIFEGYEEGKYFSDNPNISIINNRFLVFSRGGLKFSLYDIELQKIIVHSGSPWNSWHETIPAEISNNKSKAKDSYKKWIQINLQSKIETYIYSF